MDAEIVDLIEDINAILSFVEDVNVLKDKLKQFEDTIRQVLDVIRGCCCWIIKYLEADIAGMKPDEIRSNILTSRLLGPRWKVFVEAEQVRDYKSELASLSTKLNGATIVHIAHTTEVVSDGSKTSKDFVTLTD